MTDDLSKCSICGGTALFTDSDPGANPVSYCSTDLPAHLVHRASAGQLPLKGDSSKTALLEQARELQIEGRTTLDKGALEIAVVSAEAERLVEGDAQRPSLEQVESMVTPPEQEVEGNAPPARKRNLKR